MSGSPRQEENWVKDSEGTGRVERPKFTYSRDAPGVDTVQEGIVDRTVPKG